MKEGLEVTQRVETKQEVVRMGPLSNQRGDLVPALVLEWFTETHRHPNRQPDRHEIELTVCRRYEPILPPDHPKRKKALGWAWKCVDHPDMLPRLLSIGSIRRAKAEGGNVLALLEHDGPTRDSVKAIAEGIRRLLDHQK